MGNVMVIPAKRQVGNTVKQSCLLYTSDAADE